MCWLIEKIRTKHQLWKVQTVSRQSISGTEEPSVRLIHKSLEVSKSGCIQWVIFPEHFGVSLGQVNMCMSVDMCVSMYMYVRDGDEYIQLAVLYRVKLPGA